MISNETINGLVNYFETKESRTEQEQEFLDTLRRYDDVYPITGVTKQDLDDRCFDTRNVTPDQMEELSRQMRNDYLDNLFWESLENLADLMEMPRKKEPRLVRVYWDTDGEVIEDLPTEVRVPSEVDEDGVADWLSDEYGWCVEYWEDLTENN